MQRLKTLSKCFTSYTRTVPPCFLSIILAFSQVQLREPGYSCVQYVKMEVLATASQKNREKELSFQREQQLSSHSYCTVFIDCERS